MLSFLKSILRKETRYYGWDEYKEKIDSLDLFAWQQRIRNKSAENACKN